MLTQTAPARRAPARRAAPAPVAIVASEYNRRYVDAMLRAAKAELKRAGAQDVCVVRVPGAFEIPVVAAELAQSSTWSAIVCLGVILRGETTHAQHIGEAVTAELARLQTARGIPVIHEVLLLENEAQARARCLGKTFNRGAEAARTALQMARVMADLRKRESATRDREFHEALKLANKRRKSAHDDVPF